MSSHVKANVERFTGFADCYDEVRPQAGVRDLMKSGLTEQELGIDELRDTAVRVLGDRTVAWYYTYRIRLGVK